MAVLRAPAAASRDVIFSHDIDAVVGQDLHRWYAYGRDRKLIGVLLSSGDPPDGGTLEFDVTIDTFEVSPGGSIFTTVANRPKLGAGENVMTTVAPDVAVLAVGHYLTVSTISVGTPNPGSKIDLRLLYE